LRIIDGHHRWAAVAAYSLTHPGTKIPVAVLNVRIHRAMQYSQEFDHLSGIKHEAFAAPLRQKAAAEHEPDEGFEPIVIGEPPADAPPKPDDEHPWNWINGRWIWIPTDTGDGVPTDLQLPEHEPKTLGGPGSGDVEGHEFHGNQWTDGKGGSQANLDTDWRVSQEKLSELSGTVPAVVEMSPISVKTAKVTADVLTEMKQHGYHMPNGVNIRQVGGLEKPHGATEAHYGRASLVIEMPAKAPDEASPEDITRAAFSSFRSDYSRWAPPTYQAQDLFAVRSFKDMVVHEMAHVQQIRTGNRLTPFQDFEKATSHFMAGPHPNLDQAVHRVRMAVSSVSDYAHRNPAEFVAEAFVRKYRGEKLTSDAEELYELYKGPKIRRRQS
jgi:hypothetical protein